MLLVDNLTKPLVLSLAARLDELERIGNGKRSVTESSLAELSPFSAKSVGSERATPGKSLVFCQKDSPKTDHLSRMTQTVCKYAMPWARMREAITVGRPGDCRPTLLS
jgi:hypothetical protein